MASNKDAGTPREEETHELLVNKDNTEVDTHVVKDVNKADGVPGLPVDRGWAWMILLGRSRVCMLLLLFEVHLYNL